MLLIIILFNKTANIIFLIFVFLKQWLLQPRETEASFVYIISSAATC